MDDKKIYFRGFLRNPDDSILYLKLKHGFNIKKITLKDALDFIVTARHFRLEEAVNILFQKCKYNINSHDPEPIYVIDASLDNNLPVDKNNFPIILSRVNIFDNEFVHNYLNKTFRLIRLFKEGDLRIPVHYFYIIKDGKPTSFLSHKSRESLGEMFHLDPSELNELYKFVENTKLPFEKDFLQLAFENYEYSYNVDSYPLSFLILMISLESLFNISQRELRYRTSRNVAVLLGKNLKESETVFSEVKKLYDKRSKLVHTGKLQTINKNDLVKLRHYVRESIKKMYNMKLEKDEILKLLNTWGFEEKT